MKKEFLDQTSWTLSSRANALCRDSHLHVAGHCDFYGDGCPGSQLCLAWFPLPVAFGRVSGHGHIVVKMLSNFGDETLGGVTQSNSLIDQLPEMSDETVFHCADTEVFR